MDIRRFVRGQLDWDELELVGRTLAARYNRDQVRIVFLETNNWLSTPVVVDDEWFVKIISPQNAFVHALFTGARNIGVFASGEEGFFERHESPLEMSRHELRATEELRSIGINAPKPIEAFGVGDMGIVVLEFLPQFRTLNDLDDVAVTEYAPEIFDSLSRMHDHQLAHGDLRDENVLIYEDQLYFIDATNVRSDGIAAARAYDLASAIATLAPRIGSRRVVRLAANYYEPTDLLAAREFLDFVNLRPDYDFDSVHVKGEIDTISTSLV